MSMNTQNTPFHPKLWHREFWLLAFANLFLSMSVYMLIPILPKFLMEEMEFSSWQVGIVMGVYSIGLFLLGPFLSWLIQRYRRNVVCLFSMLLMASSLTLYTHGHQWMGDVPQDVWFFVLYRIILGATFGLSQMILCSTLIIDVCESFQRTEANHSAAWFGRIALSLGPMAAILMDKFGIGEDYFVFDVSAMMVLVAFVLVLLVKFPFKVPDENISYLSLDRFFLLSGWIPFVNLVIVTMVMGILLSMSLSANFYGLLMLGFFFALLSEKFVFSHLDSKMEIVTGLLLMTLSVIVLLMHSVYSQYIAPVLIGFGIGIVGARFLLMFIQVSLHCQRGTSQSSYFLAWESGLGLGLFVGYGVLGTSVEKGWYALVLVIFALLMYMFITYPWCMKHKHR